MIVQVEAEPGEMLDPKQRVEGLASVAEAMAKVAGVGPDDAIMALLVAATWITGQFRQNDELSLLDTMKAALEMAVPTAEEWFLKPIQDNEEDPDGSVH